MFGTSRRINKFEVLINRSEEDDDECYIFGCPSYTSETDFSDETTEDVVEIHLSLSANKFDKIVEQVRFQQVDILLISIGEVSGFYSAWSPSISTKDIKVLADIDEHEVIVSDGCKINPSRLGDVGKFNITLTQQPNLGLKEHYSSKNIEEMYDESRVYDGEEVKDEKHHSSLVDKHSILLAQLVRNETFLSKVIIPIWFVFLILSFLLGKLFF